MINTRHASVKNIKKLKKNKKTSLQRILKVYNAFPLSRKTALT